MISYWNLNLSNTEREAKENTLAHSKYLIGLLLVMNVGCTVLVKRQYQPVDFEKFSGNFKTAEMVVPSNDSRSTPIDIFSDVANALKGAGIASI